MDFGSLNVKVVELEPGQEWTDECVVTFQRDEAHMLAVVISQYVSDAKAAIKAAKHAAAESNPDTMERVAATLAIIKLMDSTRTILRASGAIGSVVAPEPTRTELAEALATAREEALGKADEADAFLSELHNIVHEADGSDPSHSDRKDN